MPFYFLLNIRVKVKKIAYDMGEKIIDETNSGIIILVVAFITLKLFAANEISAKLKIAFAPKAKIANTKNEKCLLGTPFSAKIYKAYALKNEKMM